MISPDQYICYKTKMLDKIDILNFLKNFKKKDFGKLRDIIFQSKGQIITPGGLILITKVFDSLKN